MKEIFFKKMSQYNFKNRKILKTTNTDHHQYPKYRRHHFRMCGDVEKVEVVEVGAKVVEAVHWMKSRHSASARNRCTWSSSFAPWTVSAASTAPYSSCGVHTTPCTSCWPPRLPLHQFIQCMDLITDVLHIGPNRPSPKHRAWRI